MIRTSPPLVAEPVSTAAAMVEAQRATQEHKARIAESVDMRTERMARDIEAIIARQESVDTGDLYTLGWSLDEVAELAPEALQRVSARAIRTLN